MENLKIIEININENLIDSLDNKTNLPACYILFQNLPIPRLGTIDKKGILYIGKADNLFTRVPSLQDSVLFNCTDSDTPTIKGHQSLSRKVFRIKHFLKPTIMTIKVIVLPKIESNHYLESFLLESYVKKYGELPPLNGQYGKYTLSESENYLLKNDISIDWNFI